MKKTLIALMALAGVAMATSPITLVDQWTFDGDWTSDNGKSFAGSATQVTDYGTSDGIADVKLYASNSGWYLNDTNSLNLTSDWAIQITMGINGTVRNVGGIFNTNNGDGLSLNICSSDGVNYYSLTNKNGGSFRYDAPVKTDGTMVTYTLLNYNGQTYLGIDDTWYKTSDNKEYLTQNKTLNKLTLGYRGDDGSSLSTGAPTGADVYITLDDIKVYSFNHNNVTDVDSIKAALIPEPATATLSLLALAGLCARRRRK